MSQIDLNTLPIVAINVVHYGHDYYDVQAAFEREAERMGWSQEAIKQVVKDAQSKDKEHFLYTMSRY